LEFRDYLWGVLPVFAIELLAALAGTYYLTQKYPAKNSRYLVLFLWGVFIVEILSAYAPIAHFSDYKYFSFVECTKFGQNYWLFNIVIIVSFVFYIYYFRSFLDGILWRKILKYTGFSYVILCITNLFFFDVFFNEYSQFNTILGTLLLILTIAIFYFELLKSDVLLKMKYFLPLYISVGTLIFHLCILPIDIYSKYILERNPFFLQLKTNVYLFGNIFLYSTYILGFIKCSRKKKSY